MVTEVEFPADAPWFKGHFPGRPVTPGVLLIDRAVACAEKMLGRSIALKCIKKVKFSNPVLPGERVALDLCLKDEGEMAYSFSKGEIPCASGVLVF